MLHPGLGVFETAKQGLYAMRSFAAGRTGLPTPAETKKADVMSTEGCPTTPAYSSTSLPVGLPFV
jgi:hypothetical protein